MGALHPAQALLNLFREPQFNYLEVQNFLDNTLHAHCVLLSDLAKAFGRVNPHWIIRVLVARQAPYWVLRHILFGRRVLHKIKSTFRPPLAIHSGVDMGRAFSVLLFCVAMDPWYHHVHKIPRVLVNKGYMDDNATGGSGLQWLAPAERLFQSFASAGFLVLSHSCYRVEVLPSHPDYILHLFLTVPLSLTVLPRSAALSLLLSPTRGCDSKVALARLLFTLPSCRSLPCQLPVQRTRTFSRHVSTHCPLLLQMQDLPSS